MRSPTRYTAGNLMTKYIRIHMCLQQLCYLLVNIPHLFGKLFVNNVEDVEVQGQKATQADQLMSVGHLIWFT